MTRLHPVEASCAVSEEFPRKILIRFMGLGTGSEDVDIFLDVNEADHLARQLKGSVTSITVKS